LFMDPLTGMNRGMVIPFTVGRMGNFLFQAAATIGYARHYGLDFTMPAGPWPPRNDPVYLPHLVNESYDPRLPATFVKESVFHYHEIPFKEEWIEGQNIILDGYWQSERYFKDIRGEILTLFGFGWMLVEGMVSVHVRRGDYLKWVKKHPKVPAEWITRVMSEFPGYQFKFFSDDIPWCKKMFGHRKDCSFSEGKNEVEDLENMSWCEHQICSASTFSWWGAWLNRNPKKRVIMPKKWFVDGWGGADTKDVVPPEWERL